MFDFASAFSELENIESYFIHCTGHPNKRGYKLLAKSFSEFLSQSGLMQEAAF